MAKSLAPHYPGRLQLTLLLMSHLSPLCPEEDQATAPAYIHLLQTAREGDTVAHWVGWEEGLQLKPIQLNGNGLANHHLGENKQLLDASM